MKHIIDDSDKNKYEAYTKQEVLEVIQEAISSGELPEEINGLVLTFKNPVDNQAYKIAFCTQAKYNELESAEQLEANCIYYITDDTTLEDLETAISMNNTRINTLDNDINNQETGLKVRVGNVENDLSNNDIDGSYHCYAYVKNDGKTFKIRVLSYTGEMLPEGYELSIERDKIVVNSGYEEDGVFYVTATNDISTHQHLYRHDLKLTKSGGGAYNVVFSLYLSTSTPLTSTTDITNIIGTSFRLNAGGYYLDSSTSDVGGVNYIYGLGTTGAINVNYSRIQNGKLDNYNGSFGTSNTVVSDIVTQIF